MPASAAEKTTPKNPAEAVKALLAHQFCARDYPFSVLGWIDLFGTLVAAVEPQKQKTLRANEGLPGIARTPVPVTVLLEEPIEQALRFIGIRTTARSQAVTCSISSSSPTETGGFRVADARSARFFICSATC
jgi:hypothetical protein